MEDEERIDDVDELELAMKDTLDTKVPASRKSSLASMIGLAIAAVMFLLFFSAIATFWGEILVILTSVFYLFGWNSLITSLITAAIFLFIGVTVYILSKRGNEAVSKIEAGLRIMNNDPPTRFYDLSEVPTENILRELVGNNSNRSEDKGRGCNLTAHEDNRGFDVKCDTIPKTKSLMALEKGQTNKFEWKEKALIIGIFCIFGGIIAFGTFFEVLTGFAFYFLWILFMISLIYVLMEAKIIRFWGMVVILLAFNIIFVFIVDDAVFLWSVWGIWIAITIIVATFYIASKNACVEKGSWYCDYM